MELAQGRPARTWRSQSAGCPFWLGSPRGGMEPRVVVGGGLPQEDPRPLPGSLSPGPAMPWPLPRQEGGGVDPRAFFPTCSRAPPLLVDLLPRLSRARPTSPSPWREQNDHVHALTSTRYPTGPQASLDSPPRICKHSASQGSCFPPMPPL